MDPLPDLMVAPNGARLTKADHPAIPETVAELVACAIDCHAAGADGLHAHVRDENGLHVLDAGLYAELTSELGRRLPGFYVQVTSEAAGRYAPDEQRRLVETLRPRAVSVALREITAGQDETVTARFFAMCRESEIAVQNILYDTADIDHLAALIRRGVIPGDALKALIVLGRYSTGKSHSPADVARTADHLLTVLPGTDWAACAFGAEETACLLAALKRGGKARVGFENNRLNADGSVAANNAERVRELVKARAALAAEPTGSGA